MPFIQLQFRRGTAAEWLADDPVLAEGELGLETDTKYYKIGDGVTVWSLLPYGGLNPKQFTIYLDYSSPSQLSRVYLPPGLMTDPTLAVGGTFTADSSPDLVFLGTTNLALTNTNLGLVTGFVVQGYIAAGEWIPIPGANISQNKVYYSQSAANSITIKGLNLGNINGGNSSVKPSFGSASGFLVTITLLYQ